MAGVHREPLRQSKGRRGARARQRPGEGTGWRWGMTSGVHL
jgi:hypothetical protein